MGPVARLLVLLQLLAALPVSRRLGCSGARPASRLRFARRVRARSTVAAGENGEKSRPGPLQQLRSPRRLHVLERRERNWRDDDVERNLEGVRDFVEAAVVE
eukprot:CAMPEP_0170186594 /NCGR_PEP_ID=MMETSP0040_2-20121228/39638_1 /TAXON_ID=641309 /ORGANISM="Lotharella oceanica, Strain CCMP622" /LENGTH=101 /DNA_ID=CAMNT_0010433395 /DNA_START=41 /DNA_END=343 /DNA_ORIENTATION=+